MRRRQDPRIGPADAERLLIGDTTGSDQRGLAALLDAVKAPASPQELSGERAAVAGFVAAYRGSVATTPKGRSRVRRSSLTRAVTMKVAAGAAVLVVGGTAMAAETGNLPVAAQEQAHGWFSALGVPPPESATPTSGPVPTAGAPAARPEPTVTPGALPSATTPGSAAPDAATAGGLCRAWQAAGSKPRGQSMKPASRRALADLAGGEAAITGFCTRQLAGFPAAPTTETPAPSATTSHPGKGIGNGPGNGRSGDAPHP